MPAHRGFRSSSFAALLVLLLAALCTAAIVAQRPAGPEAATDSETVWTCPMHPDYTMEVNGRCPRCGMALVRAAAFDVRDYRLDFDTVPAVVRPGRRTTLRFKVFHPRTGAAVTRFVPVHEKQYHLFVISEDMAHFEHIHPEQKADGSWTIDAVFPTAGYYKILSDFLPEGGAPQFVARPLVTAGYTGDLAGSSAALVPDSVASKTVGDVRATVAYDPPAFVSGLYGHLNFHLTDTATGRPITDLQTYLGAFGHTLITSEDMTHYVHAHPLDILAQPDDDGGPPQLLIPIGADLETLRGGPDVTFEGLMPAPGVYRAWTQFRRHDTIRTFAFTFRVGAAP